MNIFEIEEKSIPDELMSELRKKKGLKPEEQDVVDLFDIKDKLSVDEVLIGLYNQVKKIKTRKAVISLLYRLCKKKIIFSVTGKQGVYRKMEENSA